VDVSIFDEPYHSLRPNLVEALEQGTPNFHGIAAVLHGLNFLRGRDGGMSALNSRLHDVQSYAVRKLTELRHASTGRPLVRLYRLEDVSDAEPAAQGPTVACTVLDDEGLPIGHSLVEKLAGLNGIALRGGCFCNPGACTHFLGVAPRTFKRFHQERKHVCSDANDIVDSTPTGAVRLSFGYYSTVDDVNEIASFLVTHFARCPAIRTIASASTIASDSAVDSSSSTVEQVTVTALYVYPVKGVFGVPAEAWPITPTGFFLDRDWMILEADTISASGTVRCVTPKTNSNIVHITAHIDVTRGHLVLGCRSSRLAEIRAQDADGHSGALGSQLRISILDAKLYSLRDDGAEAARALLAALRPIQPSLLEDTGSVAYEIDIGAAEGDKRTNIRGRIVNDFVCYPPAVAVWLSRVLGAPVRLVRRREGPKSSDAMTSPAPSSFSNSGAFLVVSEASHQAVLGALVGEEDRQRTTHESYRANIVVTASGAFRENKWERLILSGSAQQHGSHGDPPLALVSAGGCPRCQQVGVRKDGSVSAAPLAAIAGLSRRVNGNESACAAPGKAKEVNRKGQAILGELFNVQAPVTQLVGARGTGAAMTSWLAPARNLVARMIPGVGGAAPNGGTIPHAFAEEARTLSLGSQLTAHLKQ
jgi:uncharacterized protein YcbX